VQTHSDYFPEIYCLKRATNMNYCRELAAEMTVRGGNWMAKTESRDAVKYQCDITGRIV